MRVTTSQTTDFRLQACKHDRLREALEFRPRLSALPVAPAAPEETVQISAKFARSAKPKSLFGSAVAVLGLAASWFLMASVVTVDFSDYETDTSTPQIVRPVKVITAPALPQ
jgi:hypothetical protein